jgi:phage terminase small subunit
MAEVKKKLTAKQQKFCREYLVDLNATQAAIRSGYSRKSAQVIGHENLTKPIIQQFIQASVEQTAEKTQTEAEWVISELKRMYGVCGEDNGKGRAKDATNAIRSLQLIGNRHKLFTDRVDHTSSDGSMSPGALTTEERRARIKQLQSKK